MKNFVEQSHDLPSISVLMPTLNAERHLDRCLSSIRGQNYPRWKVEIVVSDGGSEDRTLAICNKFRARAYHNPLKTAEAGKAVALQHAKNDLVALIDSDNILPDKNWFRRMVEPFLNEEVVGSEPWEYVYRAKDGFIDRYCAMLGMNDPLCYFLGNYDRQCLLSKKWTNLKIKSLDKGNWLKMSLTPPAIPTIGANGTIFRRKFLSESGLIGKYLFDIDVLAALAERKPVSFAKVKTGIVHLYCGSDIKKFIRKQTRRIKDFLYYQKIGARRYPWGKQNKVGIVKFVLSCVTILPLVFQAIKGYLRKKDRAWFFHPLACWLTLFIYSIEKIKNGLKNILKIGSFQMNREKWSQ